MIVTSLCWNSRCSRYPRAPSSAGAGGSSRRGRRSRCCSPRGLATYSRCSPCAAARARPPSPRAPPTSSSRPSPVRSRTMSPSSCTGRVLPLTLVVLVVAFGALVAAMLPVIVGLLAITIALGLVTIAARYLPMSVFVLNITTMVGLGVGIDYSLLIVTRFREELNRGLSPADAAVRTIQTAGSAVVTSGLTVVVGFAALILTPLTETRSVGVGGLIVVGLAGSPDSRR